jgi:hypothetical protein
MSLLRFLSMLQRAFGQYQRAEEQAQRKESIALRTERLALERERTALKRAELEARRSRTAVPKLSSPRSGPDTLAPGTSPRCLPRALLRMSRAQLGQISRPQMTS